MSAASASSLNISLKCSRGVGDINSNPSVLATILRINSSVVRTLECARIYEKNQKKQVKILRIPYCNLYFSLQLLDGNNYFSLSSSALRFIL